MLLGAILGAELALQQPSGPTPAAAPAAEPPISDNVVEEVVVTRRSQQEQRKAESDFVRQHSAPTRRGRLARWNNEVCPGVVGWPHAQASFVTERIAQEARAVGLEVGRPGCKPDILILVTSDGDRAAREVREKFRKLFVHPLARSLYAGGGGQSVDEFVAISRPVRWWHLSEFKGSDGRPMAMVNLSDLVPGAPDVAVRFLENATASRLASSVREDIARAFIIVDTSRLKGVTYEELASYLAMVSLAQLNPDPERSPLPTILTLFTDPDAATSRPETLSDWDRAFLKGLYAAPDNSLSLHTQRGAIRRSMRQASGR